MLRTLLASRFFNVSRRAMASSPKTNSAPARHDRHSIGHAGINLQFHGTSASQVMGSVPRARTLRKRAGHRRGRYLTCLAEPSSASEQHSWIHHLHQRLG